MRSGRLVLLGILVLIALGISPPAAGAAGPTWVLGSGPLAGEAKIETAPTTTPEFVLKSLPGGIEFRCTTSSLNEASISGSNPGTFLGELILEGCRRQGWPMCEVNWKTGASGEAKIPLTIAGRLAYASGQTVVGLEMTPSLPPIEPYFTRVTMGANCGVGWGTLYKFYGSMGAWLGAGAVNLKGQMTTVAKIEFPNIQIGGFEGGGALNLRANEGFGEISGTTSFKLVPPQFGAG